MLLFSVTVFFFDTANTEALVSILGCTEASPNMLDFKVGILCRFTDMEKCLASVVFPFTLFTFCFPFIAEVTRTVAPEHFTVMTEDTVQNCLIYGGNVSCLFQCRSCRRRPDCGSRSEVNLLSDYLETSTVINYAKLASPQEPASCSLRQRRLLLESMRSTMSPCCLPSRITQTDARALRHRTTHTQGHMHEILCS